MADVNTWLHSLGLGQYTESFDENAIEQDAAKAAIEQYGGYVARYMGDGVLAYFGYPQANEDDAERAVRAALEMVGAVRKLATSVTLAVRVGIATGPVVVGDIIGEGTSQENAVVGETPNLAARLQTLAASNCVVIGDQTRRLTAGAFVCADLGEHSLKGFDALKQVWEVRGETLVASRFEALRGGELASFFNNRGLIPTSTGDQSSTRRSGFRTAGRHRSGAFLVCTRQAHRSA